MMNPALNTAVTGTALKNKLIEDQMQQSIASNPGIKGPSVTAPKPKLPAFNSPEGQRRITEARINRDLGPAPIPAPAPTAAPQPDMKLTNPSMVKTLGGGDMLGPDVEPSPPDLSNEPRTNLKPTGPDRSAWDTDGYAGPAQFTKRSGSALGGYDQTKWENDAHQTPKYAIGGILSQFDPTKGLNDEVMAALKESYPNARRIGNDKITFTDDPNEIPVDILNSADAGGRHWQWAPVESGGGAPGGGAGSAAGLFGAGLGAGQDDESMVQEFIRAIMAGNKSTYGKA